MGRKNWESIPEEYRPLPYRTNIVLTNQSDYVANGAIVVHSIGEACSVAAEAVGAEEIFVIGGEEIYRQFLPLVTKCYVTYVLASVQGDVHFPELEKGEWSGNFLFVTSWQGEDDQYQTAFQVFARRVHL